VIIKIDDAKFDRLLAHYGDGSKSRNIAAVHSCSEVVRNRHSNSFSAKLYVLVGCYQWDNLVFALICSDNKNTVCNHLYLTRWYM